MNNLQLYYDKQNQMKTDKHAAKYKQTINMLAWISPFGFLYLMEPIKMSIHIPVPNTRNNAEDNQT